MIDTEHGTNFEFIEEALLPCNENISTNESKIHMYILPYLLCNIAQFQDWPSPSVLYDFSYVRHGLMHLHQAPPHRYHSHWMEHFPYWFLNGIVTELIVWPKAGKRSMLCAGDIVTETALSFD